MTPERSSGLGPLFSEPGRLLKHCQQQANITRFAFLKDHVVCSVEDRLERGLLGVLLSCRGTEVGGLV